MSAQETFPPGSLVRKRPEWYLWHGITGRVVAVMPHPTTAMVRVQWANRAGPAWERADDLLPVPERPRDAVRTLAPGVEQSEDTCDGKPRLAGTRTPTDVANAWDCWGDFHAAHPHVTPEQYDRAVLFEAGIAWGRERRRRRKERRAVKRYERVRALAEGGNDGTTEGR